MPARTARLAGTGFEGRDKIIRARCAVGSRVVLQRESDNPHDENAIAVLLKIPRFCGLFGYTYRQIGYIKATTAQSFSKRLDRGEKWFGTVSYVLAPPDRDYPRVTIELDREDD